MGKAKSFKDGLSKKQWRRVRRRSQKAACIIYGIYDFSGNLRYVGQSRQRPEDRLKWFYKNIDRKIARKQKLSPIEKWVDSQQFHGLDVLIKIIGVVRFTALLLGIVFPPIPTASLGFSGYNGS